MENSLHVLHTWLIAQVIHPVIFHLWMKTEGTELAVESHLSWMLLASLFSFQAFLIFLLLFRLIRKRLLCNGFKFTIWMISALTSIPFTMYLIAAALGGIGFFIQLCDAMIPGSIPK